MASVPSHSRLCHEFVHTLLVCALLSHGVLGQGLFASIPKSDLSAMQTTSDDVVVTLVTRGYDEAGVQLIKNLRGTGAYTGDIVLLSDGLTDDELRQLFERILGSGRGAWVVQATDLMTPGPGEVVPNIPCGNNFQPHRRDQGEKRVRGWRAYYLKTLIFSRPFFSKWKRVLYMDSRMNIHRSINPIFQEIDCTGLVMANPDSWPQLMDEWKLSIQFWPECDPGLYNTLSQTYDLNANYFQSGVIFFDTSILQDDTWSKISELYHKYGVIASGDQPIMSLYFHNIMKQFRPLPYRTDNSYEIPYDFGKRSLAQARYIITAWGEDQFCPANVNVPQSLQILRPVDLPPLPPAAAVAAPPGAPCECPAPITCPEQVECPPSVPAEPCPAPPAQVPCPAVEPCPVASSLQSTTPAETQIQSLAVSIQNLATQIHHGQTQNMETHIRAYHGQGQLQKDMYGNSTFVPKKRALPEFVFTNQCVDVVVPTVCWVLILEAVFLFVMLKLGFCSFKMNISFGR